MGFHYGLEKKKFDRAWDKLRRACCAAGMAEAAIEELYQFDWQAFKEERAYRNHTQPLPQQTFDDDGDRAGEDNSPLLHKFFDALSVPPQETAGGNRYGWVDEIASEQLRAALETLSQRQLEILTLIAFEGYTATEAGKILGLTQQGVSWHMAKLKKILKSFRKNL